MYKTKIIPFWPLSGESKAILSKIFCREARSRKPIQPGWPGSYEEALSYMYYKKLCWNRLPYIILLSHFRSRIIVLTIVLVISLQEIISRDHACPQNHTNHNDVGPILFQLKSLLPFSLLLLVWRLQSTTTKSLRHLHCRRSPLFKSRW